MPADDSMAVFVDTNIWLYAFIEADDARKTSLARRLLKSLPLPMIRPQVLNEICVNLLRRNICVEAEIQQLIASFFARGLVSPISEKTYLEASRLRTAYSLSYWDSLIVSAALVAGAATLYSEDMHHGQLIEGRLRITNPFVENPTC